MRRELERVEIPGEADARERAWGVVLAAYGDWEPTPRPLVRWRWLAAVAVAAALVAAALSPPGDALLDRVRDAVGVEEAAVALFELPADGHLLATTARGAWVVAPDGSRRFLGRYREASWSPQGRFVVAARANELAALEPDGDVRWTLARPDVRFPRWAGTATDTRIAYLSGSRLHVVAGDGTGDVDAGGMPAAARVAPAWKPGLPFVVAYATARHEVYVYELTGALRWGTPRLPGLRSLAWTRDGRRLVAVSRGRVTVFTESGRRLSHERVAGVVDAVPGPDGRLALVVRRGPATEVLLDGTRVFAATGAVGSVSWSPDGRWLLVPWREADQWVFVRVPRGDAVRAAANVADQFGGFALPQGWCCPREEPQRELAAAAPRSQALGRPDAGRLVDGVELPSEGRAFFTWDPVRRTSPNPRWRRYAADRVVATVLGILEAYAADHPGAPRVGVGDLSRPHGGPFLPKHVSHQNGLDVDVYYPRLDGAERPPETVADVDLALAQDLVDRFVAAGAEKVFVGPSTGLTGPPGVVQALGNHDDHLHARFGAS